MEEDVVVLAQKKLQELTQEKAKAEAELRDVEVQLQVTEKNIEQYQEYLQNSFGTTDLSSLDHILESKKEELQKWVESI